MGPFFLSTPHHHRGHQDHASAHAPLLERSYSDPTAVCGLHMSPMRARPEANHRLHRTATEKSLGLREVDTLPDHRKHVYPSDDISTPSKSPHLHSSAGQPTPRLYRNVSMEGTNLFPGSRNSAPMSSTPIVRRGLHGDFRAEEEDGGSGMPTGRSRDSSPTAAQLKKQIEVNKELKRLLVASVGSDLQLRLEQMIQEKAELSYNLDASLQQLVENSEDLDRVSIECDIWRSKYLASRVMIDELAGWKAELSLHFKESLRALQCLLSERREVTKQLAKCHAEISAGLESATCSNHQPPTDQDSGPLPQATYVSGNVAAVSPVQSSHKG